MIDMTKERFTVPGVQSQTSNESGLSPDEADIASTNGSLQIKPVNRMKRVQQNTEYGPPFLANLDPPSMTTMTAMSIFKITCLDVHPLLSLQSWKEKHSTMNLCH
jgi:hypothetical protein